MFFIHVSRCIKLHQRLINITKPALCTTFNVVREYPNKGYVLYGSKKKKAGSWCPHCNRICLGSRTTKSYLQIYHPQMETQSDMLQVCNRNPVTNTCSHKYMRPNILSSNGTATSSFRRISEAEVAACVWCMSA